MIQKSQAAVVPISLKQPISTIQTDPEHIWKDQLRNLVTDTDTLLDILEIDDNKIRATAKQATKLFPLKATHSYINSISKANINDPLLRQILPLGNELDSTPGYTNDPTGDQIATQSPGLLHKYAGRVLIILTSACAIHCRYCFRREYPYADSSAQRKEWQHIQQYLKQDSSIEEVILSGGDPLMLDNKKLADLLNMISDVPHIKRIRIHSRLPIVLPERITPELCRLLAQQACKIILVVHSNHPNELSKKVEQAINMLTALPITIFNQAVLLAGVNDQLATLKALSEDLFSLGIIPYYLHVLDKVKGAAHFAIPESEIDHLYKGLLTNLPGYLVPKLVMDLPEKDSKTPWSLL